MADVIFNSFLKEIMDGTIDLDTDEIRCQPTNGYVPNIDSHTRMSDAYGLIASGIVVASPSVTQDNTDDEGVWDGADLYWTASSFSASGMIVYCQRDGTASNQNLIGWFDFGQGYTSTAGLFTVNFPAEGILNAAQG